MTANNNYIAALLHKVGLLTPEEAEQALQRARLEKRHLIDLLVDGGNDQFEMLSHLAAHSGMEAKRIDPKTVPAEAHEWMDAEIARRYGVAPLERQGSQLSVALSNPLDLETIDTLHYLLKYDIHPVITLPETIQALQARLYPPQAEAASALLIQHDAPDHTAALLSADINESDEEEPIIRLVNLLIIEGFRQRASDIHLEPLQRQFRVRYRIDGVLREVEGPPRRLHPSVISRIKIMSGMKISEKRLPQDGRIEIKVMGRELDLRVSAIPTNHGESMVLRILNKESLILGLPNLGFLDEDRRSFEKLIRHPDGITLITGPTGSGKTTTLYACLNTLNQPNRKIITVEDPVEYQLNGINQVQVQSDIGLTFSAALRSILRQAPNVIMIGEIRDRETAEIAVNAALTGHLVLSTLHTNDAPSAITRLIDIGIPPFLVSSSLRGILAQRLVRTICSHCKTPCRPTEADLRLLGSSGLIQKENTLYHGAGCASCGQSGYKGRKGIFELMQLNDEIRQMIYAGASTSLLRHKAREQGMTTLREDGLRKVIAGLTTLPELLRVTMGDEA